MDRIVVGVDGSPQALAAVKWAALLASPLGAHLVLACVRRPVLLPPEEYSDLVDELHRQSEKDASALLEQAILVAESSGVTAEIRLPEGSAAETLVDLADAERAKILVVGSRGRGAVARVLLGSVADRCIHISHVPVLVVH